MRGTLAQHLEEFIKQVNIAINDAKEQGIVPTPEMARERLNGLSAFVSQCPDIAFTADRTLETQTGGINLKVYSPAPDVALPVMIFFHGGGHMCGSTELYDPMCRKMALAANCVVISVDYRLAPEHRYPAGIEDAEFVLGNYQKVLTDINYSAPLIIAGDSAGGAICTTLSMKQAEGASLGIQKQILIYPSVDYTMSQDSIDDNGTGYFLEKTRISWYFEHYFDADDDRTQASPLYGTFNSDIAETMIVVAGCDPLRDEGLAYGQRLVEAGVKVRFHKFDGMIHAFMNIEDIVPEECKLLYQHIADFIAE